MKTQRKRLQRYYLYDPDTDAFDGIGFPVKNHEWVTDLHWKDAPRIETWKPRRCEVLTDDSRRPGDFPTLNNYGSIPVMSERAWIALRPLIGRWCEALPIIHPSGEPYYVVHVMNTLDCLDKAKSDASYSEVRKERINEIYRYAFRHEMLTGQHIFKLPHFSGGELIVDDEFRKIVQANRLKGLLFKELPLVEED